MEEVKEKFYKLSEQHVNQIANSYIKIIRVDFNSKVGKVGKNPPLAMKVYIMKSTTTV
jgi:hypothetical protein